MRNSMCWFELMKKADTNDWGHGDTLHGQMKNRETKILVEKIMKLKTKASNPKTMNVLPRWSGEVRRKILLLPPVSRVANLSMYEIDKLSKEVDRIEDIMARYRTSRLVEIINGADNS